MADRAVSTSLPQPLAARGRPTKFGPQVFRDHVEFRLWAPAAREVTLLLIRGEDERSFPMRQRDDGWHCARIPEAAPGDLYFYELPDGSRVPDPASRFNPQDVHGPSQVPFRDFEWQCADWRGRPWEEAVIYEMHVGTFTERGTFKAAQEKLAYLHDLGITAVQLMPLADFPGQRNWGYDGVLPFAPDSTYGTPRELREFVDAAHALGMMVLLDVVYNHFGPEGNYIPGYCPQFFNPAHQTPWGAAINFDAEFSRDVRDFYVENALYWLEEFRFDGLRMDAVHAIEDSSSCHIVEEICAAIRAGPGAHRHVHVVLENERNQASWLVREALTPQRATAQWNDDLHHAVHVLATGEQEGYYADYARGEAAALFARALAEGFIYQGQSSIHLKGATRGEPSAKLPSNAFVSFLQTHDQVGNRAMGERIHTLGKTHVLRAARACVLLSPHIPMLFMGEEYAATTPFQFFCDFAPDLARAVREGRRREFSHFEAFAGAGAHAVPDPGAETTFIDSKLLWEESQRSPHAGWLRETRALLALRRRHIVPLLAAQREGGTWHAFPNGCFRVDWHFEAQRKTSHLCLLAHFGETPIEVAPAPRGRVVYALATATRELGGFHLNPGGVHITMHEGKAP